MRKKILVRQQNIKMQELAYDFVRQLLLQCALRDTFSAGSITAVNSDGKCCGAAAEYVQGISDILVYTCLRRLSEQNG